MTRPEIPTSRLSESEKGSPAKTLNWSGKRESTSDCWDDLFLVSKSRYLWAFGLKTGADGGGGGRARALDSSLTGTEVGLEETLIVGLPLAVPVLEVVASAEDSKR